MDAPGVVLVIVGLLWGSCILSLALHVKMGGEEDKGKVTPGRNLRGIEGGKH